MKLVWQTIKQYVRKVNYQFYGIGRYVFDIKERKNEIKEILSECNITGSILFTSMRFGVLKWS